MKSIRSVQRYPSHVESPMKCYAVQNRYLHTRIWFSPDAAGYIKEKIWHDTQEIVSQKDGSINFEAEVAGTEEIKHWVMSWGAKAVVLEPESLRQEILAESAELAERYSELSEGKTGSVVV